MDSFINKAQGGASPSQAILKKKGPPTGGSYTDSPNRRASAQRMSAQARNSGQLLAGMNVVKGTPRLQKIPGGPGSPNLDETLPGTQPLLSAAEQEIEAGEQLRKEILAQRREAQEHRQQLEKNVNEQVRLNLLELKKDKDSLEAILVHKLEQIHHLELSKMDVEVSLRERRKNQRSTAVQHMKLQRSDNTKVDVCAQLEGEHNDLRDVIKHLSSDLRTLEDHLNECYAHKARLEADIAEKRHTITINDAMHRARPERPRIKPGIPVDPTFGMTAN